MNLIIGVVAKGKPYFAIKDDSTPTSIFRVASISKVLTSLALAHLVDRGEIGLEDEAQTYLPAFQLPAWQGEPILVKHLATHTSGILDGYYRWDDGGTLDGFAAGMRALPLASRPGKTYAYSNIGASLLGNLMSVHTGLSYADLVDELVCRPLDMTDTVLELNPEQQQRLLSGHDEHGKSVPTPTLPLHAGSGGYYSTAKDLVRLLAAHVSPTPTAPVTMVQQRWAERENGSAMGLGWHIHPLAKTPYRSLWHNGSLPGYRSYLGFVPEVGCGVVALTNSERPTDRIATDMLADLVQEPAINPAHAVPRP